MYAPEHAMQTKNLKGMKKSAMMEATRPAMAIGHNSLGVKGGFRSTKAFLESWKVHLLLCIALRLLLGDCRLRCCSVGAMVVDVSFIRER